MAQPNSVRLAKNTMFMYIRMFITLCIGLYSARIILQYLGVEDYGIYNLVGSVIGILSMLKELFASASQRFLNFEMGRKNYERLNLIFNMSVLINLIVSVVFVIAIEIIGWWFFTYEINIDPSRIYAAKVVFHLSVVSSVVMIMTAPYDALIIANERMDFYAIVSILNSALRLGIILLIPFFGKDRLITYGILLLVVTILIRIINNIYCAKHFKESIIKFGWDKATFKEMFSFAGWQLFGNSGFAILNHGLNMVFNVFGGAVVNAARGLAYQLYSAIKQFQNNVLVAITPYCNKAYAAGNKEGLFNMFFFSSKVMFCISVLMVVPVCFLAAWILQLWLSNVPDYTIGFVQIMILVCPLECLSSNMDMLYKSFGIIKPFQINHFIVQVVALLVSYFVLRFGGTVYVALAVLFIEAMIVVLVDAIIANKRLGLVLLYYLKDVVFSSLMIIVGGVFIFVYLKQYNFGFGLNFVFAIAIDIVILVFEYYVVFNKLERSYVKSLFGKRLSK